MVTITIALPESMQSFVEAQAAAGGYSDVGAYVQALIADVQKAHARAEMDAKLLDGVEALERGEGRELAAEDWERLRTRICEQHGRMP
jgi:Arc/MetJ-type ribon-helix-helix transcriptional regulator